jgi:hypothetical protein
MFFVLFYVLQTVYSFYMLQKAWKYDWNLNLGDAIFFGFLSLIPFCFLPATIVCIVIRSEHRKSKPKIILRKYEDRIYK